MAAAALAKTKGVTGVTTTKGLFTLFTLLCLVCLSSSLKDKNQKEELIKNIQKLQQEAERRRAEHSLDMAYIPTLLDDLTPLIDTLSELLKTTMSDFTPLLDLMDDLKTFLVSSKKYINKNLEESAAEMNDHEEKLRRLMEKITHLKDFKDEL